jgi:C4-dicarboxylate-specific signal transduction histidine kinase
MADGEDPWRRRFERERAARKDAERLLHEKSREIFAANQALAARAEELTASLASLRETQEALIEREKMAALGALVAGIAHEVNTPLGVAVTALSLSEEQLAELRAGADSGRLTRAKFRASLDELAESLGLARRNAERGAAMVRSFKKVAVDRSSEEPRELLLCELMEDVLASMGPMLRKARVETQSEGCAGLRVCVDAGALVQVLTNLVQNACIHAFEGVEARRMQVRVESGPAALVLEVEDNGVGMSDETAERVFQPFFTTRRSSGGSGLGMHVVQNLVTQRFEGEVVVRTSPGGGTLWQLRLPYGTDALRFVGHE